MPTLLQINPVLRRTTSTGRIMQEIGELAIAKGWDSFIAYGKGRDGIAPCRSRTIPVGSKLDVALHAVATRLFDAHGLASKIATRRFIRKVRQIDPDVIHIHNIHGYFLNYKILFDYLAKSGKPVIWTVHDCWLFTGHCYHYASAGCYRWKTHCGHCPQKGAFPASLLADRSGKNFDDKKKAFNSVRNLTIVPVSEWMKNEMKDSFLKDHRFEVIRNGIDLSVFKPTDDSAVRRKHGLGSWQVILGVASIWSREKGIDDFISLASELSGGQVIVLVGKMSSENISRLPENIVHIDRTDDVAELSALYSSALALVNPTWQDNYPTVNLESIACGTPVITYRTGGSIEAITEETGFVVDQGDVKAIYDRIRLLADADGNVWRGHCREHALAHFSKEDRYQEYITLYEDLATR